MNSNLILQTTRNKTSLSDSIVINSILGTYIKWKVGCYLVTHVILIILSFASKFGETMRTVLLCSDIVFLYFPVMSDLLKAIKFKLSNFQIKWLKLERRQKPEVFSRIKLVDLACEEMLPSFFNRFKNMHFIPFSFLCLALLLVCILLSLSLHRPRICSYFQISVSGFLVLRYLRCYFTYKKYSIDISDQKLSLPVFGFFKTYKREFKMDEIKKNNHLWFKRNA